MRREARITDATVDSFYYWNKNKITEKGTQRKCNITDTCTTRSQKSAVFRKSDRERGNLFKLKAHNGANRGADKGIAK